MTDIFARQRQLIATTAEWASNDIVIGKGELALEQQGSGATGLKIGNGASAFSALPYWTVDGIVTSTKVYADTEALESSIEPSRGEGAVWTSGKASYLELAIGAPEGKPEISNAVGVRLAINQNKYDFTGEGLGIKMTGLAADANSNRVIMQNTLDWLASEGQGGRITLASEGHMTIDRPIDMRDRVIIDGRGALVDNVLDRNAEGASYLTDACFLLGIMSEQTTNRHDFQPAVEIVKGSNLVTFSNPAATAGYAVGDVIRAIHAMETAGDGSKILLDHEFNRVKSIVGGVLELEYPWGIAIEDAGAGTMGVDPTGAWVANYSYRVSGPKGVTGDTGTPIFILDRAELHDLRMKMSGFDGTSNASHFTGRAGFFACHLSKITQEGVCYNGIYGNAMTRSLIEDFSSPYWNRFLEIKVGTHNLVMRNLRGWKSSAGINSTEQETLLSVGERAREVLIDGLDLDTGNSHSGGGINLLAFSGVTKALFRNVRQRGTATFSSIIASPEVSVDCGVEDSDFEANSSVHIEDSGQNLRVANTVFRGAANTYAWRRNSTARGGELRDLTFVSEGTGKLLNADVPSEDTTVRVLNCLGLLGVDDGQLRKYAMHGNQSSETDAIAMAGASKAQIPALNTSSLTEVLLCDPIVIPAGALRSDTILSLTMAGNISGAAGDRYLSARAAIDTNDNGIELDPADDTNIIGLHTLPASCSDWSAVFTVSIQSSSVIVVSLSVTDGTNATTKTYTNRFSSADFANHPLRMEVSGYVADASDLLITRSVFGSARRYGYVFGG